MKENFKEINSEQVFELLKNKKVLGVDILVECEEYVGGLLPAEYKHITVDSILGRPLNGFGKLKFFVKTLN